VSDREAAGVDGRMLEIKDLSVRYGSARVLDGVSLHVRDGEIVGVLGSNGAGKSTLLRAVSGLVRPMSGRVLLAGQDTVGLTPAAIVRKGISQVAEGRRIFRTQSVVANLELGAYTRRQPRREIQADLERIYELFPVLHAKSDHDAAMLSGGEQQMLAIGQAMMASPRLLLMDEPSLGLAPIAIWALVEQVRALRSAGTTVLVVEQQLPLAKELCDRLYFLRNGRIVIDGVPPDQLDPDAVRAAYV
jgi:branched-chain amino acid transport system ATP-binding protein